MTARLRVTGLAPHPGWDGSLTVAGGEVTLVRCRDTGQATRLLRVLAAMSKVPGCRVMYGDGSETVDLTTCDVRTLAWIHRHHLRLADDFLPASPSLTVTEAVARTAGSSTAAASAALDRLGQAPLGPLRLGEVRGHRRRLVCQVSALLSAVPVLLLNPAGWAATELLAWAGERAATGTGVLVTLVSDLPGTTPIDLTGADPIRPTTGVK